MSEPMLAGDASRLTRALGSRYALERELGAGGMATVYLGRDVRHDRRVALKVLRPELAAVIGAERFLAEIRTTASLQHPHILPLFDSGESARLKEAVGGRYRIDREIEEGGMATVFLARTGHMRHGVG